MRKTNLFFSVLILVSAISSGWKAVAQENSGVVMDQSVIKKRFYEERSFVIHKKRDSVFLLLYVVHEANGRVDGCQISAFGAKGDDEKIIIKMEEEKPIPQPLHEQEVQVPFNIMLERKFSITFNGLSYPLPEAELQKLPFTSSFEISRENGQDSSAEKSAEVMVHKYPICKSNKIQCSLELFVAEEVDDLKEYFKKNKLYPSISEAIDGRFTKK